MLFILIEVICVLWLVGFPVTALLMEVASSGKPREIRGSVALYL